MMSACSVSFPAFHFNDKKNRVLWKLVKHYSLVLLNVFKVEKFCVCVNYEINVFI